MPRAAFQPFLTGGAGGASGPCEHADRTENAAQRESAGEGRPATGHSLVPAGFVSAPQNASAPQNMSGSQSEPVVGRLGWKLHLFCVSVLAVLAIVLVLRMARSVALPCAFAFLLSLILRPIVQRLNKYGIPDFVGAAVTLLIPLGITAFRS